MDAYGMRRLQLCAHLRISAAAMCHRPGVRAYMLSSRGRGVAVAAFEGVPLARAGGACARGLTMAQRWRG
eukprot:6756983-Prymnesium_polylepis.1